MKRGAKTIVAATASRTPREILCRVKCSTRRFVGNRRSAKLFAVIFVLLPMKMSRAQNAPVSPDRPWRAAPQAQFAQDLRKYTEESFTLDPTKIYDLGELVDLAEQHNPETRVAWQNAKSQAAALGVARSELYPTIAATALSETDRSEVYLTNRFFRQTIQDFQVALDLNYTVFDFGARAGRINAARAQVLAANFA
ncbi:MAG TPA: TolC family protein, partial [Candidatus Acidoferrum sp.]|nr:TolC family protein [Candidatus Acidoferrum sp.]